MYDDENFMRLVLIFLTLAALFLPARPASVSALTECCVCRGEDARTDAGSPCSGAEQTVTGDRPIETAESCDAICNAPECVRDIVAGACPEEGDIEPIRGGVIVGFTNPLCRPGQPCNLPTIIGNIIRAILGIVGSIALLMFIYGGFLWMVSAKQGGEKKVRYAKDVLKWSALGLLVIFASYIIVNFVINLAAG